MMSTMQSFIIISKDGNQADNYVKQFCLEKQISQFDITFVAEKPSIGIAEIRQIQQRLYQKPHSSPYKAIIILNAQTLTIEAQNALLKTLEEPPAHALIFLLAQTKEVFLPTVLSRCKVISLDVNQEDKTSLEQYIIVLEDLPTYSISQRLKLAQDAGKTKETALSWLENMLLAIRSTFVAHQLSTSGKNARALQKTHTIIKTTNVSPRFALENLLLSL